MKLPILHTGLAARFPAAYKEIIAKLQSSKAKSVLGAQPADLEWSIEWCVAVSGGSFTDLIGGTLPQQGSFESRVRATISAKKGRWYAQSDVLDHVPQEILDLQAAADAGEAAETARLDALSPEDRDREIEELLGQLRGPGFIEVKL